MRFNNVEEKVLLVAEEISEDTNLSIDDALLFMDVCHKYDIKHKKAGELESILKGAKDNNAISTAWKKMYNNSKN